MFDENSGLVKVWLDLIKKGRKTLDDVPNVSNLREVIEGLVNNGEESREDDNL